MAGPGPTLTLRGALGAAGPSPLPPPLLPPTPPSSSSGGKSPGPGPGPSPISCRLRCMRLAFRRLPSRGRGTGGGGGGGDPESSDVVEGAWGPWCTNARGLILGKGGVGEEREREREREREGAKQQHKEELLPRWCGEGRGREGRMKGGEGRGRGRGREQTSAKGDGTHPKGPLPSVPWCPLRSGGGEGAGEAGTECPSQGESTSEPQGEEDGSQKQQVEWLVNTHPQPHLVPVFQEHRHTQPTQPSSCEWGVGYGARASNTHWQSMTQPP
jgi:hypothetical protein